MRVETAFGRVLRELRDQKQLSQEKLALISGLDRTFISLLERGLRQPSLNTIIQLSTSLSITPSQLVQLVEAKLSAPGKKSR